MLKFWLMHNVGVIRIEEIFFHCRDIDAKTYRARFKSDHFLCRAKVRKSEENFARRKFCPISYYVIKMAKCWPCDP